MVMVMTMTGMAATLDTIAEQPGVEAARAESLHQVLDLYIEHVDCILNLWIIYCTLPERRACTR